MKGQLQKIQNKNKNRVSEDRIQEKKIIKKIKIKIHHLMLKMLDPTG